MSRLIKPSEYAKSSGISRQAVYAKIKKGLLKSKKVDGKIFIQLDSSIEIGTKKSNIELIKKNESNKDLILAKDETIKILKETIKDLKDTNNLIVGTLKGEVDLLKDAFGEMQQLYRTQIEHLQISKQPKLENKRDIDIVDNNSYIEIKELAKHLGLGKKERKQFTKTAIKLFKSGDFRFVNVNSDIYGLKSAKYDDFM